MEWKTKISKDTENGFEIRGNKISNLIEEKSFSEVIYLLIRKKFPSKEENDLFNSILVSSIDHGISPPSVIAARCVTSGGVPLQNGIAAGILTLGDYHGGAIEGCSQLLQSKSSAESIVDEAIKNKNRISGFGHKKYKDIDPRASKLFEIAKRKSFFGKNCEKCFEIAKILEKKKNKKFPINIDGAQAAILSDMEFSSKETKALFIISRTVGLSAHVLEEIEFEKPFRRLD